MADTKLEKFYTFGEELTNCISHGIGTMLSISALVLLIIRAAVHAPAGHTGACVVGFTIFGVTLVLLYSMSTLYHAMLPDGARKVFRILDHTSIYALIAGTYTAFCLSILRGGWGWSLFGVIWGLAVLGITLDAVFACRLKKFSLVLYLLMGWLMVIAIRPLLAVIPPISMKFLVWGGILYTAGAVFFVIRKKWMHTVWHFFVLTGSILHFFAVYFVI